MALLLQEPLADATGSDQHHDLLRNFNPHGLQTYHESMEHGAEDSYNRTWSGMDLLTSAFTPTDSVPETPQACIDNDFGLHYNDVLPSHHNTYSNDYNIHGNPGEQGAPDSTHFGIQPTFQPGGDSINLLSSDYPFPWNGSQTYPPSYAISLSANPITDDCSPDMTEFSTPTSSSICQKNPSTVETFTSDFRTDNQRWHATQSRLRAADESFLYGVLTTKIFCRPSCASRRPSRRHVRFFPFPGAIEAAQQANFRPCKRCNPELLGTTNTSVLGISQVLRNIIAEANSQNNAKDNKNPFKLEILAQSAGLSPFHFHRLFKATTQLTPGDFISACRALALQDALGRDSDDDNENAASKTVAEVNSITNSLSFTPRTARKALGNLSPTSYATSAPGTIIKYTSVDTPCGRICIAFSTSDSDSFPKTYPPTPRPMIIHAVLIGADAEKRIRVRLPDSNGVEGLERWVLERCVRGLEEEARDRDTEIGDDVLGMLWRARVWVRLGEGWGE